MNFRSRHYLSVLLIAALYFVAARTSLLLAFQFSNATPVWPPSGMALAAVLLLGRRIWPGIALGAFAANLYVFLTNGVCTTTTALWVSALIALGNTGEAMAGYYLLRRSIRNKAFQTMGQVIKFASAALVMCIISAFVGTTAIFLSKMILAAQYPIVSLTWWTGDVSGVLIVAPLLIVWANSFRRFKAIQLINNNSDGDLQSNSGFSFNWNLQKAKKAIIPFAVMIMAVGIVFDGWLSLPYLFTRGFLIIPILVWVALRLEQREVVTAIAVSSVMAIWGTINGHGPFGTASLNESLLTTQSFICLNAVMILAVWAVFKERRETEIALREAQQKLSQQVEVRSSQLASSQREIQEYENRINSILKVLLEYAQMNFSVKAPITGKDDELDAIAIGLNTMGEELQATRESEIQLNKNLRESEEKFNKAFSSSPVAMVIFNIRTNKITDANNYYLAISGYSREEIIGHERSEISIIRTPGVKEQFIEEVLAKGSVKNKEIVFTKKSGETGVLLCYSEMLTIGGDPSILSIMFDVTDSKKAELEIHSINRLLNDSQRLAHIGSWEWDIVKDKFTWSEEMYNIYELSPQNFQATYDRYLKYIHPEDREIVMQTLKEAIADSRPYEFYHRIIRPKGEVRIVHTWGEVFADEKGAPVKLSATMQDVTEKRMLIADLELRTEELTRSNKELEQFAYVASHDLQEPLRTISSYVQLLKSRYQNKLDKQADEFINFTVDATMRMRGLINDLLAYSRVSTRAKVFEQVDCNYVVKSVISNFRARLSDEKINFSIQPLPVIQADQSHIAQLFQNLISNAIKFKKNDESQITINAIQQNGQYLFSVSDNGIGIAPQYKEKIFILFQRLHHRNQYPGTGIGLAICKKIVEQYGGKIWVESKEGEGSAFYFTIANAASG